MHRPLPLEQKGFFIASADLVELYAMQVAKTAYTVCFSLSFAACSSAASKTLLTWTPALHAEQPHWKTFQRCCRHPAMQFLLMTCTNANNRLSTDTASYLVLMHAVIQVVHSPMELELQILFLGCSLHLQPEGSQDFRYVWVHKGRASYISVLDSAKA